MRTVFLPSAQREVILGVFHKRVDTYTGEILAYDGGPNNCNKWVRPATAIKFTDAANPEFKDTTLDEQTPTVMAVCHSNDNFSKLEGRRRAAMNLLRTLRKCNSEYETVYSVADRRAIFQAVCPEYKAKLSRKGVSHG